MAGQLRQVNLEQGLPTVEQALRRLDSELITSKRLGYAAVKLIHGYGSSGRGGKIRVAVRRELSARQARGQIVGFVPGERFSIFEEETRQALQRCDALRSDRDLERYNNGVTFVIL
ncbi:MAG: Smr/MutS family protein [Clostridiales bacterium]|nr:Smr/MutS family protein [Clostridiales bacterium]